MSYGQQEFNKEWLTFQQYVDMRKFFSKQIILEKIIPNLDNKDEIKQFYSYVHGMIKVCHTFMFMEHFKLREFLHLLEAIDFLDLFCELVPINPLLDKDAMVLLKSNVDQTRELANKQIDLMKTKFEETLSDVEKFRKDFEAANGK